MTNALTVKAYETADYGADTRTQYCVTADGAVFSTGARKATREVRDNFEVAGDTWTRVDRVPDAADFIGTYATPTQLV